MVSAREPRIGRKTVAVETLELKPVVIEIPMVASKMVKSEVRLAVALEIALPMISARPETLIMFAKAKPPPSKMMTSQAKPFWTLLQEIRGTAGCGIG